MSPAARNAVVDLLRWKFALHGVDARAGLEALSADLAPAVDAVLKGELQDTVIVIEGGDLQ